MRPLEPVTKHLFTGSVIERIAARVKSQMVANERSPFAVHRSPFDQDGSI
jgi:hypothetical protein